MSKKFSVMLFTMLMLPGTAFGMHIMEGFLPVKWSIFWSLAALPFIFFGVISINKVIRQNPSYKMVLGFVGAFAFVLSALKLPSVTGSCSHPTGVGLGAILFGPWVMSVIGGIVLLFQAILLGHGGLSTLGANIFSMGIVGPFVSYIIYKTGKKMGLSQRFSVFLAATLGDLLTYVTTSFQLSVAFPAEIGGIMTSFTKFMGVFAVTQIPLAISEGLLTVIVVNLLSSHISDNMLPNVFMKEV